MNLLPVQMKALHDCRGEGRRQSTTVARRRLFPEDSVSQSVTPGWPDRPQLEERTLEGSSLTSVKWAGEGVLGRGGGKVGWEPYTWLLHFEGWDRGIAYQGLC